MQIEYGPPGHKGVTEIMGVGDDGLPERPPVYAAARAVEYISVGTWIYAWASGDKKLKKKAGAVAIGAFVVALLAR